MRKRTDLRQKQSLTTVSLIGHLCCGRNLARNMRAYQSEGRNSKGVRVGEVNLEVRKTSDPSKRISVCERKER